MEAGMCQICTEMFDKQDHLPLLLACGHTFCKACLRMFTGKLKQARLQYNSNPNDRTGQVLEDAKLCPNRCPNAFYKDSVDELQVNQNVL